MMAWANYSRRQTRQQGAALVVALVLVLVSTLLGVSTMQSSDIETQLANNARFQQASFRAAEAASTSLLTVSNVVTLVNDSATSISSSDSIDSAVTVSADFKALGDGPASGYSLGGLNGFRSLKFIASATATIPDVDSTSRVVQGVKHLTNSREN